MVAEILNHGNYEKHTFTNRGDYLTFLRDCEYNPSIQVLDFTDTYMEGDE